PAPQRIDRHGPIERRATFVEHSEIGVNDLSVVVAPDGSVRIGRRRADRKHAGRASKALANTFEAREQIGRGGAALPRSRRADVTAPLGSIRRYLAPGPHFMARFARRRRNIAQRGRYIVMVGLRGVD